MKADFALTWMGRSGAGVLLAMLFMSGLAPLVSAAQPPRLVVLSPTEEKQEQAGELLIAIAIVDPDRQIDITTVRLLLDGRDVTGSATVTADLVTYVPAVPLEPGERRFELRLRSITGEELPGIGRVFRVEGETIREPGWEVGGRFVLDFLTDDRSGGGASRVRQRPSTGHLRLGGHVGQWKYGGTVYLTSDDEQGFQPRNRYQFHLDRGWAGLDLGDVNYQFSPYVLRGKRTRGAGGYVRLGGVEITALRGEISRAVEGTLQVAPPDSAGGLADTTVTGATFRRNLVGARLAFGRGRTFQFAFDGVRVRDDVESLTFGILPKDNLVIGGNALLAPFHRRLIFEAGVGLSYITEDISGGAISKDEIKDKFPEADIPVDPRDFEDIFIMNLSTRPLNPPDLSNLAMGTSVKGNVMGHIFEGRYERVGSAFRSLAAPAQQSDKAGVRLTDSFRLLRNRLQLAGEFERFNDNLEDDKEFSTSTAIYGGSATFVPGRVDIKDVSVAVRIYQRDNDAGLPDSAGAPDFRVDESTTSFRVGTGYHFWFRQGHDLALSYLRAETDALDRLGDATQTDWNLGWTTRFERFPLAMDLGFGVNKTEYPGLGREVEYTSRSLGGTYSFLDKRLDAFASLAQVVGDGDQPVFGADKTTWNMGARYRLDQRAALSGRLSLVSFSDRAAPDNDYHETVLNLRLVQEF